MTTELYPLEKAIVTEGRPCAAYGRMIVDLRMASLVWERYLGDEGRSSTASSSSTSAATPAAT